MQATKGAGASTPAAPEQGASCWGHEGGGPYLFWSGAALGAAAMYLLDPSRGKRRRHVLRDRLAHAVRLAGRRGGRWSTDLRNHARGMLLEIVALATPEKVSDDILEERVRAELGHTVHHPRRVHAAAEDGIVTLSGTATAAAAERLADRARHVRGVVGVISRLSTIGERAAAA